jgi:flagellar assembly factor FliW
MDAPELAFVLMNPFQIREDYLQDLAPDEAELFRSDRQEEVVVFVLVTVPPGHPEKMTANLLGPLVIDSASREGRQAILAKSGYDPRQPVLLK